MSVSIIYSWRFRSIPSFLLSLQSMGSRSRLVFLLGRRRWWKFFHLFLQGSFSSSEDSLSLLELLDDDDDESSDSGFIALCVDHFNLEEGPDEPSPAEPQGDLWTFLWLKSAESCTGCFDFEEGLGGPSPAEP